MAKPKVIVIAGPNGAGKSTAAPGLLRDALGIHEFVNADQIAAGLSAYAPQTVAFEAGRIMLRRLHSLAAQKASFAFESTLASRTFAPFLRQLKAQDYEVELFYLPLPSAQVAIERVAFRVRRGGHDIPRKDIERRYERSLRNVFNLYLPIVDRADFIDNADGKLRRIASIKNLPSGTVVEVKQKATWLNLQRQLNRPA